MLEEILQRIDENLHVHTVIADESKPMEPTSPQLTLLPPPPAPPDFLARIYEIRSAHAPFYVVSGSFPARLLKRAHNLVMKFFGRKQAYYNNLTLNLIETMAASLASTQTHLKSQSALINALSSQMALQQSDYQQLFARAEREQQGISTWIDLVARKAEMAAMNAREAISIQAQGGTALPEPRILDPEQYAQRLAEMNENIRVNVGCGEKPLPEHINVDMRPLPNVDVLADAHRLPFDPSTVFEISSAHLIEHFREHHVRVVLLPYWKSLLRPGGQLRVICPNWGAMIEQLNAGEMPLELFKKITFGAQDYEGDDHFAMYTPETLEVLLLEAGFHHVERITLDRMNGGCPEMELVART
jgi:hypothetical protein